jgi:PIN domain nuclease of toxin-antitoxin system
MTTYVLDSSALLRYFDDEAGADRVFEIIRACAYRRAIVCISAIQWGEIAGRLRKKVGPARQSNILTELLPSEAEIVPVTGERAVRTAEIRSDRGISYADAFAIELALDSPEHVLVTADYGFKPVEDLIRIEFLPAK